MGKTALALSFEPGHHVKKLLQYVHKRGADLVYLCPEPQSSDKQGDLILTPLELIDLSWDNSAALIPPPRIHRHRYCGVLAPNSPLRAAALAMAQAQLPADETVVDTSVIGSSGSLAKAIQTEQATPKPASAAL